MFLLRFVYRLVGFAGFLVNLVLFVLVPVVLAVVVIQLLEGHLKLEALPSMFWGHKAPYMAYTLLFLELIAASVVLHILYFILGQGGEGWAKFTEWWQGRKKKAAPAAKS